MQIGISVIIPVYNVEKYLEECLDSVLKQTFSNYEIICVNDGSTDGSTDILDRYAVISDKITVISQKNQGLSVARNMGIMSARGKYICFLDGDDMLMTDALQKMWDIVGDEQIEILTYELSCLWYENEYLKKSQNKDAYYQIQHEYKGVRTGAEFFVEMIENNDFIDSACLMLINLEWLKEKQISFYPDALFEDSVYVLQSYFQCEKMRHIKEGLYIYRIRQNSIMTEKLTYKHLYYRIWQYSECLKMIYTYAKSEREVLALSSFAERSLASAKYVSQNIEQREKEKIYQLTGLYKLLAKGIGVHQISNIYNVELKLLGLLSEIHSYSKVLIYGAGVVGNKVKNYICLNQMSDKIIGFAVSQKQELSYIDNLIVKCLSEYESSNELLLIIAAQENYHQDMLKQARLCGYEKIRMIDYEIESMLDKKLEISKV